jgi:hypothetical protein
MDVNPTTDKICPTLLARRHCSNGSKEVDEDLRTIMPIDQTLGHTIPDLPDGLIANRRRREDVITHPGTIAPILLLKGKESSGELKLIWRGIRAKMYQGSSTTAHDPATLATQHNDESILQGLQDGSQFDRRSLSTSTDTVVLTSGGIAIEHSTRALVDHIQARSQSRKTSTTSFFRPLNRHV